MYIRKIKLENVAGIYAGLQLDELDIDLMDENGKNVINLICGTNGSGKSTLMNSLSPFAVETIRENETGIKVIIYEKKKWVIEIMHIYKPKKGGGHTTKSFIIKQSKLDDEIIELNPNGNVSTFLDAVEQELGITPAKMKLLQLGNDMTNLLKMTSTERKKYITEFTSDVDIYLEKFRKVSSDFITVKKMLENIGYNLVKLGNINSLEDELKNIDSDISSYNNKLMEVNNIISNMKQDGEKYSKYNDYSKGAEEYTICMSIKNKLKEKYNELIDKSDIELANMKGIIDRDLRYISSLTNNICNDIINMTDEVTALEKINLDINNKLNDITYKKVDNLKELIKSYVKDITNISNKLTYNELDIEGIDISFVEMIENECRQYKESLSALFDHIDTESLSGIFNIDYKAEAKLIDSKYSKIISLKHILIDKNTRLLDEKKDLSSSTFLYGDICRSCPKFGNEFINKEDYDNQIEENSRMIVEYDKEIIEIDNSRDKLKIMQDIYDLSNRIANMVRNYLNTDNRLNIIKLDNCSESNYYTFLTGKIMSGDVNIFNFERIAEYKRVIAYTNRLNDLNAKLSNLKLISLNNEKYDDLISSKNNNNEKIISLSDNISKLKKELSLRYDEIRELEKRKSLIQEFLNDRLAISNIDKLKEDYDNYNEYKYNYECILGESNKYLNILENDIKPNISRLNNRRDSIISDINEYKKLIKQKDLLNEYYTDIEITKKALSPNKGIPLKSINSYLQKTRYIANQILKEAFDGEILLDEFIIDEKEFKIPVYGKGDGVDDASKCSSGERALITLAISLAMYKQNNTNCNTKYNVLGLDELDGPLDEDRRRKFLHLLETQIKSLNISQVFNITHNNMFNDVEASIILLKGAKVDSFIDKKILFKF